jgi:hypothetical protein
MNYNKFIWSHRRFNNQKNIKSYFLLLITLPVYLYQSLVVKDFWALVFISCLALYIPILWSAFPVYLCFKTYNQFKQNYILEKENVQNDIIKSVQTNQLQKLAEAIDANPDILYCDYQRRSLIAWCRYYQNTKAQELIIQLMEKHPNIMRAS